MFHVKDTFKLQDLRSHCQALTAASGLWPDTVSGSGWGTRLTHDIHSGSVKRTFNSSAYSVTWMTNPEVKQRRQFSLSWLWVPDHRVHRDCPSPLCSPQTRTHSDSKATTTLCQHSPASTSSAPPTLLLPPSCACVITWSESPLPSPNSVNQECVCVCVTDIQRVQFMKTVAWVIERSARTAAVQDSRGAGDTVTFHRWALHLQVFVWSELSVWLLLPAAPRD